jgi:hypothetical protein
MINIKTVLYLIFILILWATICSARAGPPPRDYDNAADPDLARVRAMWRGFYGIIGLAAIGIIVVSLIIFCCQYFCCQYICPRPRSRPSSY